MLHNFTIPVFPGDHLVYPSPATSLPNPFITLPRPHWMLQHKRKWKL